ncbi:MAG: LptE family protein [Planctomycetes bacterium]|nr:LptE family protein [Planctomycetota bacterium]
MMRGVCGIGLLVACLGCGYSFGYRLPDGVRTLSVPTFDNQTFPLRREVEFDLTRAVRRELLLGTDADVVNGDRADAVLHGTIRRFDERVLSEGRSDVVQESSILVEVRVKLVKSVDGSVLFDQVISDHAAFSVVAGETVDDARREAINEIAERLVAELEAWE